MATHTWAAEVTVLMILAGISLISNPTDGAECGDPSSQVLKLCYNDTKELSFNSSAYLSLVSTSPHDECSCTITRTPQTTRVITEIISPVGNSSCMASVRISHGEGGETQTLDCSTTANRSGSLQPRSLQFRKNSSDLCIKLTVDGSGKVNVLCNEKTTTPTPIVKPTEPTVVKNTSTTDMPSNTTEPLTLVDNGPKVVGAAIAFGILLPILSIITLILFLRWQEGQKGPRRRAGSNYPAVEVQGVGDLR